ncbi:hypothetical protein ACWKW6_11060 [Dyadobacter jiangsuensis]
MRNLKAFTMCILIILINSCKEEEPYAYQCKDGAVKFELLNDDLNPIARLKDPGNFDINYEIIQSDDELFQKLFIHYLKKKVDFKTKSLIVISVNNSTRASVMTQSVTANCARNKLTITADLRYGSVPDSGIDYVFAIVPKIPYDTGIEFIPNYIR